MDQFPDNIIMDGFMMVGTSEGSLPTTIPSVRTGTAGNFEFELDSPQNSSQSMDVDVYCVEPSMDKSHPGFYQRFSQDHMLIDRMDSIMLTPPPSSGSKSLQVNALESPPLVCGGIPPLSLSGSPLKQSLQDPVLLQDQRVLTNLLASEEKYMASGSYFSCVQTDVQPWMRNTVAHWMLEVWYDTQELT